MTEPPTQTDSDSGSASMPPELDFNTGKTASAASGTVVEKLNDALIPGYHAEFDPEEAERAGAFVEDAISQEDAIESTADALMFPTSR